MEYLQPNSRLHRGASRARQLTPTIVASAFAALALAACADQPTRPLATAKDPNAIIICGPGDCGGGGPIGPPKYEITSMSPGAFTAEIDGPTQGTGETVTIVNRGATITNAAITG
jgi:hypothetical protein